MNITKIINSSLKSAFILGISGFILGFIGPVIITPDSNQGPLLGIFITGPIGFLFGGIVGLGIEIAIQHNKTQKMSSILSSFTKMWNCILWGITIVAIVAIALSISYVPWHEERYSKIVNSGSELQKKDKSLVQLSVRSLFDDELLLLDQFKELNYLNFHSGWGIEEAKITDSGLKIISEINLPKLEYLMLGHCNKITDDGMQHIIKIDTLKYLSLTACSQLSDIGLAKLTSSTTIETLDLRGCKGITDLGLRHLKKMPKLKKVLLGGCINITENGMDEIRKSLPNCKVSKDDQLWAHHTKK